MTTRSSTPTSTDRLCKDCVYCRVWFNEDWEPRIFPLNVDWTLAKCAHPAAGRDPVSGLPDTYCNIFRVSNGFEPERCGELGRYWEEKR